jgi:hypothetical protein
MEFITDSKRARELYGKWCDAIGWSDEFREVKWEERFLPKIEYRARSWDHPNKNCDYAIAFGLDELSYNIVQFNLYKPQNSRHNGTGFAEDSSGKYLIRKAILRHNEYMGDITSEHFRKYSNVEFVKLSNSKTKIYTKVANLAASKDEIAASTAYFLEQCRALRERFSKDTSNNTGNSQGNHGSDERNNKGYEVPASTKDILHTKISKALEKWVNKNGGDFELPNAGHWRHDGIDKKKQILYEIKTKSDANSVQTAIGQLFVYGKLFKNLDEYEKTLVIPSQPSKDIINALKNIGISIIIAKASKNSYKFKNLK